MRPTEPHIPDKDGHLCLDCMFYRRGDCSVLGVEVEPAYSCGIWRMNPDLLPRLEPRKEEPEKAEEQDWSDEGTDFWNQLSWQSHQS